MTLIRLKTRHFRTKKKVYDADTKSLIFQDYCWMSNLTICRFTSNNFNYSLLVAPSFANGGNLFVLPIPFSFHVSYIYICILQNKDGKENKKNIFYTFIYLYLYIFYM